MVNATHFKVLLQKNFLTLKRKWGFAMFFVILPIISMGIYTAIKSAISDGIRPEGHNFDELYFTSNRLPEFKGLDPEGEPIIVPRNFSNTDISSFQSVNLPLFCNLSGNKQYALIGTKENIAKFRFISAIFDAFNFSREEYQDPEVLYEKIREDGNPHYCFGLQIDEFDTAEDKYNIQVKFLRKNIPDTLRPAFDPLIRTPNYLAWRQYKQTAFLHIYSIISDTIIKNRSPEPLKNFSSIDIAYMPMKTPDYESIEPMAIEGLSQNFPFFFMFTFLIPLYYIVSKLAEEKESKAREGMKMMGLKDDAYFLSWFVFHLILVIIMATIITLMVSINVFPQSSKILIFMLAFFYGLSLFGFSIVIVAVFPTARGAATAATLSHLITYFAVFALRDPDLPALLKTVMSIFPNIGMTFCIYNLFQFESNATGLNFDNFTVWFDNTTYFYSLLMLVIDSIFFLCLGLYLDQILQSQFGVAKKWYFLCTKKFWCSKKKRSRERLTVDDQNACLLNCDDEDDESKKENLKNAEDFESVPETLRKQEVTRECLKIKGLRKEFGTKVAVDNSHITMYNGQIFALLGHNGAGKTTTISMLTGLIQASKGSANVFNVNIFEDMDEFRKILGVCPQHDVLFEFLTPREHLSLFAAFKGTPSSQVDKVVEQMIKDIDLVDVKNQLAGTLSGGQKRKLSVGIAMIGDSKVVILDEPSSGMDTSSRRRLWEMLKENKNGKIIILTTHYMDEADILGDRICIMADGKIKCCGSSLFLKNRYGVGYNLVIAKKTRDPAPQIDKFVNQHISNVKKLSEVSSEMTFQLPTDSSSQFKEFFTILDQNLDDLGIRSYGVGITTLEEVFLRIAKDDTEASDEDPHENSNLIKHSLERSNNQELEEYSITEKHEEGVFNVFFQNLKALLKKKLLLQVRDSRTLLIEMLFPILFIFTGLALATIKPIREGVPRPLSPAIYPQEALYYNDMIPTQKLSSTPIIDADFSDTFFKQKDAKTIDISEPANWTKMVSQFDDYIFDNKYNVPNGFYGNYFLHQLNETDPAEIQYGAFALINATSQDAISAYGAYVHEALLRRMTNNPKLNLTLTSSPFPLTLLETGVGSAAAGTSVCLMFAIAYMMVSDALVQNIIRERQQMVKQQMIISGVSLPAYWISHYLLDIIFQAPPSICAIIGIKAFNLDFPDAWVIILVFIFVNPLFIYVFSCLFKSDSSASIVTRLSYVFIGAILPTAIQFLLIFPSTYQTGRIIKWIFYVLPIYSLNIGISNIANRQIMAIVFKKDLANPLNFDVAGVSLIFMLAMIPIFCFILFLYESKVFRCRGLRRQEEEQSSASFIENQIDEDIIEEERRVAASDPASLTVMVNKVKKNYGNIPAVRKVSFGLEYGECFALLGVSGAGKTTTFKCLTGEEIPSQGAVSIQGFNVSTSSGFNQARSLIGYCPQFDAIFGRLTVREHLEFYAAVKGVIVELRERIIQKQLEEMDLLEFENVYAENLSGGNKRKLSVAMALIGNPPIVFLDEPSTGVDPKAKRFMWTIVSKISTQRKKSSVIITTHSMEEAEALCTKMGIMVAGRFKCFGSSQHIKAKYGTGYEIEVKIKNLKEDEISELKEQIGMKNLEARISQDQVSQILQKFGAGNLESEISKDGIGSEFYNELNGSLRSVKTEEFIRWLFTETRGAQLLEKFENMFRQCEVIEHYSNSYLIKVSKDNYSIGFLFGMMEDIKGQFSVSEYSVSQTTLEQIFNNFAKEAESTNMRKRTTVAQKKGKKLQEGSAGLPRLKSEAA